MLECVINLALLFDAGFVSKHCAHLDYLNHTCCLLSLSLRIYNKYGASIVVLKVRD